MHRDEAVRRLKQIEGQDLRTLARDCGITILSESGRVNKGWAGHVFERYLGLPLNSAQSPNFGSWELKSIPLKRLTSGVLSFKESMAITMIDEYHVRNTPFDGSHLLSKLKKAVIVARVVGSDYSKPTFVHSVTSVELSGDLYELVRADYELVQECLNDPQKGFLALTGAMGVYVQPRTKGKGHGSVSRAFYARPRLLGRFIDLGERPRNRHG